VKFERPKIYPITDSRISRISHREQCEKLIAGGATIIQLREKHASSRDFYEAANSAIELARSCGVRIIINDRVDVALALKADGVHLGQKDIPTEKAREILGPTAIIGFSTHSVEQAVAAIRLPVDYIAIGPIFETLTKNAADEAVGLDGLTRVRTAVGDFPLAAIGGITLENIRDVLAAGAGSAAVISAIISDPLAIESRMIEFNDRIK